MICVLGPFFLIILPPDYFDYGKSICPSKVFLNVECLGCGLTRGVMHLIHLDFEAAWQFNKISFVIAPVGILFWVHLLGKILNRSWFPFFDKLY
jgi:hypothetical protein